MLNSLHELIDNIRSTHQTMVTQLHQFCRINSGTSNLAGLQSMHQMLQTSYLPIADDMQSVEVPAMPHITMQGEETLRHYGPALFIRKRPDLKRRILLCGHMDTVYSAQHPFQSLTYVSDNHLQGPGVADMKGGLIVMLHALSAFEKTPFADKLGWDVFINADEETGSKASSNTLDKLSPNYQAALVYEPAMTPEGMLAKNRKGSGKLTLIATGKAAHAGRAFDEGRNAICYLSEALLAINALNGQRKGVTINIGKIAGGNALNVVPDKAIAKLDIRISQPEDEAWCYEQLHHIITRQQRAGYTLKLHGTFGRPVKQVTPGTEHLFQRIQQIGDELNLIINWQDSGGCCDGNNLGYGGLPVIDTLGVRGGDIHSPSEYILLDSLVERAALSALLLVDLAQGGLEELT